MGFIYSLSYLHLHFNRAQEVAMVKPETKYRIMSGEPVIVRMNPFRVMPITLKGLYRAIQK